MKDFEMKKTFSSFGNFFAETLPNIHTKYFKMLEMCMVTFFCVNANQKQATDLKEKEKPTIKMKIRFEILQ